MGDRSEGPREGNVPVPALCQELLVLQLLLHRSMSPELMLRGYSVGGQTDQELGHMVQRQSAEAQYQ